MTKLNLVEAINLALRQEMKRDPSVIILGEDVGEDGGVFRVTDGLAAQYGNNRVIDTPLAESAIIGISIGMAALGLKPIPEIQFEGFIFPAFDQIVNHLARMRNRSRGTITCPIVIRCPIGGGIKALEHHSDSPESYFIHTPGLKVVIPSSPYEAKGLLISAIRDKDPVIFFEPKRIYRAIREEVPEKEYTIPLGKARVVKEGADVTLITYGAMTKISKEALEQINDVDIELIDLRTLSPLDTETIINSVRKTGKAVIVHEAQKTLGFGAEIIARINEQAFYNLQAPIERVTGYDVIVPFPKNEQHYLVNHERIIDAIRRVVKNAEGNNVA
jgi:pyruvate dehydrogenase E1 component beta subunit